MRPALHIRKPSSDQLIEFRDHEHCLKEESTMFSNPREEQGFRENNPLPLTIALLVVVLPILIMVLVKRRKKKQASPMFHTF